jgi:hypothetical protein
MQYNSSNCSDAIDNETDNSSSNSRDTKDSFRINKDSESCKCSNHCETKGCIDNIWACDNISCSNILPYDKRIGDNSKSNNGSGDQNDTVANLAIKDCTKKNASQDSCDSERNSIRYSEVRCDSHVESSCESHVVSSCESHVVSSCESHVVSSCESHVVGSCSELAGSCNNGLRGISLITWSVCALLLIACLLYLSGCLLHLTTVCNEVSVLLCLQFFTVHSLQTKKFMLIRKWKKLWGIICHFSFLNNWKCIHDHSVLPYRWKSGVLTQAMRLKPRQMKAYPASRADRNTVYVKICVDYVFMLGKNVWFIPILRGGQANFFMFANRKSTNYWAYSMANPQISQVYQSANCKSANFYKILHKSVSKQP